jgi:hypothetical protein
MFDLHCIQSEILYACAFGCSRAEEFGVCVSVVNERIGERGDFNRIFVRPGSALQRVLEDVEKAQTRRDRSGISRVNEIELFPDIDQALVDGFAREGYVVSTRTFFALSDLYPVNLNRGNVRVPSIDEYMQWYECVARKFEDFTEAWWSVAQAQIPEYVRIFKPYWMFVGDTFIGYLHCAETDEFTCVHDVNILDQYRGNSYGTEMLYKAIRSKRKPIVLRARRSLERFYGKLGFQFACTHVVVKVPEDNEQKGTHARKMVLPRI